MDEFKPITPHTNPKLPPHIEKPIPTEISKINTTAFSILKTSGTWFYENSGRVLSGTLGIIMLGSLLHPSSRRLPVLTAAVGAKLLTQAFSKKKASSKLDYIKSPTEEQTQETIIALLKSPFNIDEQFFDDVAFMLSAGLANPKTVRYLDNPRKEALLSHLETKTFKEEEKDSALLLKNTLINSLRLSPIEADIRKTPAPPKDRTVSFSDTEDQS